MLNGKSNVCNSSRYLCSLVPKQYARGIPVLWSIAHQSQYEVDKEIRANQLPKTGTKRWNSGRIGRNVAFYQVKKNKCWIWKAYCRTTGELIDWEIGDRSTETFWVLLERLERFDVKIYFSDKWDGYAELIPPNRLIQSKSQTMGIERNNGQMRHWFARFRRRTCVVSKSIEMVNLTIALFAKFHSKFGKRLLFSLFHLFSWILQYCHKNILCFNHQFVLPIIYREGW